MDNTWYYTLSTIIQALASVFGLGATFLVFKLQNIDKELREYRKKAITTLVYIENKSETKYDDMSLFDISKKFSEKVKILNPLNQDLGIGSNYDQFVNKWIMMSENGLTRVSDKSFNEYFVSLLKQNAKAFNSQASYRLKLLLLGYGSGVVLTFTITLALGMLSGLTHYLNTIIFNYSTTTSIYIVSTFSIICILSVMYTAYYAVIGDY